MRTIGLIIFIVMLAGCAITIPRSQSTALQSQSQTRCDGFAQDRSDYWNVLTGKKKESAGIWRSANKKYQNWPARNLVVFIDGTGNTSASNTNVWKLYSLAVAQSCSHPVIPYYHKGVGTRAFNRLLGGGLGTGIDRLIKDAYQFLVEAYQPGDRIFIFGFSRGAYAARSLNGMVEFVGLLDASELLQWERQEKQLRSTINELYKLYSRFNDGKYGFEARLRKSIAESDLVSNLPIYGKNSPKVVVSAIGVFDTVPALGLGRDYFPDNHRTELYAKEGYHALSIDEQRNDFHPLFFGKTIKSTQVLEKVWFAGAHADIGGGYGDHLGLELLPRKWMREKLESHQLFSNQFDAVDNCNVPGAYCEAGALHDEFLAKKLFGKFGLHWRFLDSNEKIHQSVLCRSRIESLPFPNLGREPLKRYLPENISLPLKEMTTAGEFSCS